MMIAETAKLMQKARPDPLRTCSSAAERRLAIENRIVRAWGAIQTGFLKRDMGEEGEEAAKEFGGNSLDA